jgi:hypothetical protein
MTDELRLNCDAIGVTPQVIDWEQAMGENMEGYRVFECSQCQGCNRMVVSSSYGECEHKDIEHEVTVMVEGEEETQRNECDATIYNEGPMMAYWYPIEGINPEEAARKIAHLPLCVVQFEDERTGLALTGGGMDLSWEICEAFVALGYWPPLHFCDLPRMSGRGTSDADKALLRACMESCKIAEGWAARKRERLGEQLWPAPEPGSVKMTEPKAKKKAKR